MATLEEIRAKLLQQQAKTENNQGGGDRASYPFWNIPEDTNAVLRFLPDSNPNNTFFWVERQVIKMPFQGVKGEHDREVVVQVPCMDMFGKPDPILAETKPWWNDEELKPLARTYWKKRSYVFQGFVREDPMKEDSPENPIRRFIVNPSIFNIIKASLMDPEMEDLPTSYDAGIDFRLLKTKKGQYADYATSNWSRKSSSLTDEERAAVEQYGLYDLNDYLPKEPTEEGLAAIKEMFKASIDGEPYDGERWGSFYRPSGYSFKKNESSTPAPAAAKPAPAPVKEEVSSAPEVADGAADALAKLKAKTNDTASDASDGEPAQDASAILEMLRNKTRS